MERLDVKDILETGVKLSETISKYYNFWAYNYKNIEGYNVDEFAKDVGISTHLASYISKNGDTFIKINNEREKMKNE